MWLDELVIIPQYLDQRETPNDQFDWLTILLLHLQRCRYLVSGSEAVNGVFNANFNLEFETVRSEALLAIIYLRGRSSYMVLRRACVKGRNRLRD